MPSFYRKPVIKYPIIALIVLAVVTVLLNLYYNWIIGAVGLLVLAGVLYFLKWADTQVQKRLIHIFQHYPIESKRLEKKH